MADLKRTYVIANLLRHPVARVQSFTNQMMYEASFNEHAREGYEQAFFINLDFAYPVEKEFGVNFEEFEDRMFLNSLMSMAIEKRDLMIEATHIRMEDLVSDIKFFRNFATSLAQGAVDIDWDYLGRVVGLGIPNSQTQKGQAPEDIYAAWPVWRRALFTRLWDRLELRSIYEKMGYDLSFLEG